MQCIALQVRDESGNVRMAMKLRGYKWNNCHLWYIYGIVSLSRF